MRSKDQKLRFTDPELGLLKSLFANGDELLFAIRKVLLQSETTAQEKELLKGALNENTVALLYKVFMPTLDADAPLFQLADLVVGLNSEMKTLGVDDSWPVIKAKELEVEYILQQLGALSVPEPNPKIVLRDLADLSGTKPTREQTFIRITARNYLLSYIDSNCQQMKFLAGMKEETVEQTKERLARDSAK